MKTNTLFNKWVAFIKKPSISNDKGFTILELLVSLAILALLSLSLLDPGFFSRNAAFSQAAYEAECDKVFYTLLQYQNEAIMDGNRRQVRFLKNAFQVTWTIDTVNYIKRIPVETLTFSGDFTSSGDALTFHGYGTVSRAGTLSLDGKNGMVRKIVVQLGNGRIYLDEP